MFTLGCIEKGVILSTGQFIQGVVFFRGRNYVYSKQRIRGEGEGKQGANNFVFLLAPQHLATGEIKKWRWHQDRDKWRQSNGNKKRTEQADHGGE